MLYPDVLEVLMFVLTIATLFLSVYFTILFQNFEGARPNANLSVWDPMVPLVVAGLSAVIFAMLTDKIAHAAIILVGSPFLYYIYRITQKATGRIIFGKFIHNPEMNKEE